MIIKERMTPNPKVVQATAPISYLIAFMKENKLKKVPVLDGEKLVGIITEKDVERVSPSAATTLSVFELNYLLSKTLVKDAMTKQVFTCTPGAYIEDAAVLMRANRINCLCVVENDKLVGIVTESDLFDAIIDMLGGRLPGNRIILSVDNVPGVLAKLGTATKSLNMNITHFAMTGSKDDGTCELLLRTDGEENLEALRASMEAEGFRVVAASPKKQSI